MKNIINLTPHAIVVKTTTFPPSGNVARIELTTSLTTTKINGFDVFTSTVSGHNLPDAVEGTYLLVSAMVLTMAKKIGREDCIAPNTDKANRNEQGHIVSVPSFVR